MIYTLVDNKVRELFSRIVLGDLFVSIESIIEFVYFYIVADALHSKNEKIYSLSSYIKMLSSSEELEEDKELYDFLLDYDKAAHHYTNLNYKKQVEARNRAVVEKNIGPVARFDGKELYEFQQHEFLVLMKIKSDSKHEFHKTYKRIVSNKGYRSRISFTEYRHFYEYLFNKIESGHFYSNVQYYKLEKLMGFEIYKTILASIKKSKDVNFLLNEKTVMNDLLMVTKLPLLTARHELAEIYPELEGFEDVMKWRYLVGRGINEFIDYAIKYVQGEVKSQKYNVLDNIDWSKFEAIYPPESYSRNYKLRKDFSAVDFTNLMKHIDNNTEELVD